MKQEDIDVVVTLQPHRQAGATDNNLHTYSIEVDNEVKASGTIPELRFVDSFAVNFSMTLGPGAHALKVHYKNNESKGVLQVQNIYIGGDRGGVNVDSLVKREGRVVYGPDRIEPTKAAVWHHGTYWFKFESPVFYWLLSRFPM